MSIHFCLNISDKYLSQLWEVDSIMPLFNQTITESAHKGIFPLLIHTQADTGMHPNTHKQAHRNRHARTHTSMHTHTLYLNDISMWGDISHNTILHSPYSGAAKLH